jgi:hypothetical protein
MSRTLRSTLFAALAVGIWGIAQPTLPRSFGQSVVDSPPTLPPESPAANKVAPRAANSSSLIWSSDDMDTTPKGNVEFHGPFNNENITARRTNLPAHEFLQISFDLLVIRAWDGSVLADMTVLLPVHCKHSEPSGNRSVPNFFRLGLADGPTLLYTTFNNTSSSYPELRDQSRSQNYPSQVPGDHLAPQSGAFMANSLGYNFPGVALPHLYPRDAVYHIDFIIPHQDYEAVVQFSGMNLQPITFTSWGVTHLDVRTLNATQVPRPAENEIAQAFSAACNVQRNQVAAFQTLILGMDDTTNWIEKNVTPPIQIDGRRAASLIQDLFGDDQHLARREAAGQALLLMGPMVEPMLRDIRKTVVGEQRQRIDWVLSCIGVRPITDEHTRQAALASRVLEIIGTPQAMQLRKHLTELQGSN